MASTQSPRPTVCPECGTPLPPTPAEFVVWCESCTWNVGVETPAKLDRLEALFGRMTRQHGEPLRDALIADPGGLRVGGLSILATAVAWSVLVVMAAMLVGGVVLLVLVPGPLAVLVMLAALVIAAFAVGLPHKRSGIIVRRAEHPQLFSLIDDVASAMDAPRPRQVRVDESWNASYGGGVRSCLTIGYPLFLACGPQERVALLAHELGHAVNHDPRRGMAHRLAFNGLVAWGDTLVVGWSDRTWFFTVPGRLLARIPYGAARLLWSASLVDSQRAEYYADMLGARVGGDAAMRRLLSTLQLHSVYEIRVHQRVRGDAGSFFDGLSDAVRAVPDSERRRRMVLSERSGSRVDASHPPTAFREAVCAAVPRVPAVTLDPLQSAAIDTELVTHAADLARRIRYGA